MGFGIDTLIEKDVDYLNKAHPDISAPKIVIGPGTGLGECILNKSEHAPCHEIMPCEGGHTDWPPRSEEDFELYDFTKNYIETSNNVENLRSKGEIGRVSVERVCAGPAIPMIYEFFKTKHPNLKRVLEEEGGHLEKPLQPDEIEAKHVTEAALEHHDELCMHVIRKFVEIFAVETGNFALKTLPYGGIFLVGGVTAALHKFLITEDLF